MAQAKKISRVEKLTKDQIERILKMPRNNACFECNSPKVEWCSITVGIVLCIGCAQKHRGLGVHLSFVRNLEMDGFTRRQYACLLGGGNERFNKFCTKKKLYSEGWDKYQSDACSMYRSKIQESSEEMYLMLRAELKAKRKEEKAKLKEKKKKLKAKKKNKKLEKNVSDEKPCEENGLFDFFSENTTEQSVETTGTDNKVTGDILNTQINDCMESVQISDDSLGDFLSSSNSNCPKLKKSLPSKQTVISEISGEAEVKKDLDFSVIFPDSMLGSEIPTQLDKKIIMPPIIPLACNNFQKSFQKSFEGNKKVPHEIPEQTENSLQKKWLDNI